MGFRVTLNPKQGWVVVRSPSDTGALARIHPTERKSTRRLLDAKFDTASNNIGVTGFFVFSTCFVSRSEATGKDAGFRAGSQGSWRSGSTPEHNANSNPSSIFKGPGPT